MLAQSYVPILFLIGMGILLPTVFTLAGILLGPKVKNEVKSSPFEAGFVSKGLEGKRYEVKFYMTALIFLIFDVEIVFLYPWAVNLRELGWFGFIECLIFVSILIIGLIYAWKKGALEWE